MAACRPPPPTHVADRLVLTVTLNPSLDVSASVPVVEPERKLRCASPTEHAGGGGVNVARAATRLGARAVAVLTAGGLSGGRVCELLGVEGVRYVEVTTVGATRQSLAVTETSTGRQYRFSLPGPALSRPETESVLAAVRAELARTPPMSSGNAHGAGDGPQHVVLSGSLPPGVDPGFVAGLAAAAGPLRRTVVDSSGEGLAAAARAGVFLVKPNVNELCTWAGRSLRAEAEFEPACRELLDTGGGQAVLLSLGPAGALLVERDRPAVRLFAPAVRPVSTVGAGDSMVAGVVTALERGAELEEAARFGIAAGSATTLRAGSELLDPDDVARLAPQVAARQW
ncbi:MAG: 1-phosphofructokinase family hexose kinase [Acidimicrobiales bacterium]